MVAPRVTLAALLPWFSIVREERSPRSFLMKSSVTRYHLVVPAACVYLTPYWSVSLVLHKVGSTSAEDLVAVSEISASILRERRFLISSLLLTDVISLSASTDVGTIVADT